MFRVQVYNTVGRGSGLGSPTSNTFRRLSRRINHNIGLLNVSRSSNHSSSFRMRRTELSGERYRPSREHSQQGSGYGQDENQSRNDSLRREALLREVGRSRRGDFESSRPYPAGQTEKQLVENIYMLAGSQRQYRSGLNGNSRQVNQPQTPRGRNYLQLQNTRRRDSSSRQKQQNRHFVPSRDSRIGQRQRSKEQNRRVYAQQREGSRERDVQLMQGELNQKKMYDEEMHRLQDKHKQNLYQLKSPRRKLEKRRGDKQGGQIMQNRPSGKVNINSTKNMNLYYFQEGQVSTTSGGTGGVKTLRQTSKVDTVSEASLPINSVTSQKDIASKESLSPRVYQKNSLHFERSKEKGSNQVRERRKEKQREKSIMNKITVKRKVEPQHRKADSKKNMDKHGKQRQDQILPIGSVFLPVESKREEGRQWAQDILQRIILHLECLNIVADYTKQFRKMYESTQQWQTLIFLSYKKFYIERTKIQAVLKAPSVKRDESRIMQANQNPFILPYSKISQEQLARFRGGRECLALRQQLQAQNTRIRNALRGLYNLYIEKSGDHVNMFDCDNFSQEIYKLMLQELDGISQNLNQPPLVEPTKLRMGKIIKSGLLIAFINGKYVKNFAQVILHEDIVKIGKRQTLREDCTADLFVGEFRRVLSS